jgi:hypothetical protein
LIYLTFFFRYKLSFEVFSLQTVPWQPASAAEKYKTNDGEYYENGTDGNDDGDYGHI